MIAIKHYEYSCALIIEVIQRYRCIITHYKYIHNVLQCINICFIESVTSFAAIQEQYSSPESCVDLMLRQILSESAIMSTGECLDVTFTLLKLTTLKVLAGQNNRV